MALSRYAIRRTLWAIPLMLGVTLLVFVLVNIVPGSPIQANPEAQGGSLQAATQLRKLLGLDQPIWQRYFVWLSHLVRGQFGTSYQSHQTVLSEIAGALPNTLELAVSAFVIALLIAIPAGMYAAAHENRAADRVFTLVSMAGISTPSFWLGLLLIIVFATKLDWLPAGGSGPAIGGGVLDTARYLVLPAFTVAIPLTAEWFRYVRGQMLGVLPLEYIQAARAKGLPERTVITKHAFRNALLPMIQLFGLSLPTLFAGALMAEAVFDRFGMGQLAYSAALDRDYPTVMGCVVLIGVMVIIGNLLADLASAVVDPRIRVQ